MRYMAFNPTYEQLINAHINLEASRRFCLIGKLMCLYVNITYGIIYRVQLIT